jgi:predicted acylesterase/phospholipase RssA
MQPLGHNWMSPTLGRPLHEVFDLMAGTSTGGILAVAHGLGLDPKLIRDLYLLRGKDIFRDPTRNMLLPFRVKYRSRFMEDVLRDELGYATPFGACRTRVMATARNDSDNDNTFFKSYKEEEAKIPAYRVAMATASAPTFHSPVRIGGKAYIDGGIFGGDPAFFALVEAKKLWPEEEVLVVSFGTGEKPADRDDPSDDDKGYIHWGQKLAGDFLDSNSDTAQHMLAHVGPMLGARTYHMQIPLETKKMDDTNPTRLLLAQEAAIEATHSDTWNELVEALR